jgi:O-antigen ligase/tetratricopeptide (TPR) repeat protein
LFGPNSSSPVSAVQLRTRLTSDNSAAVGDVSARPVKKAYPLTLCPSETRSVLALLVAASVVFLLGAMFFCSEAVFYLFCKVLALEGAALALFGIVQQLTWNGQIFWRVPLTQGGSPFGPFVNHNQAGGFLVLCFAGALVWLLATWSPAPRLVAALASGHAAEAYRRTASHGVSALRRSVASLNGQRLVSASLLACIFAGILCSLSRGALLSLLAAGAIVGLAAGRVRRRASVTLLFGVLSLSAFALIAWVGAKDKVAAQLGTLLDREKLTSDARLAHWRDGLAAAGDFYGLGAGLGSYKYVYGAYQHHFNPYVFRHAHNQYLESLVDGGVVALALIVAMVVLVAAASWRLLASPEPRVRWMGVAGLFVVASQAAHAFLDFTLYLPATTMLFALLCGSVVGRAARRRRFPTPSPGALRWAGPALLIALAPALAWSLWELHRLAEIESALKSFSWRAQVAKVSAEEVERSIGRLDSALAARPDSAEALEAVAELWVILYRLRARTQLSQETGYPETDAQLWEWTSLTVLHHVACQNGADAEKLRALTDQATIRDHLGPACRGLLAAREACPLLPRVHLRLAELWFLQAGLSRDLPHLDRAASRAPGDPDLLYEVGALHFSAARFPEAYGVWRRSLALSDRYEEEIVTRATAQQDAAQLMATTLPAASDLLARVAIRYYALEDQKPQQRLLLQRAKELLPQTELTEDERYYLDGILAAANERYAEAVERYRQALALRPESVQWRYELALLLRQVGRLEEAELEARWCARHAPDVPRYALLLESVREQAEAAKLTDFR